MENSVTIADVADLADLWQMQLWKMSNTLSVQVRSIMLVWSVIFM